ncbi:hypothetical protein [Bacillus pinisoli]|uniref:hypothetical protein n=1 Tax=Bacillus pinisoli TaxID=2901866 RepID=UPI001FF31A42|nr:hypothetical protein [Bacillus pinisoli]
MNPASLISSFISGERIYSSPSLSLRPGQVISGKVEKLFPNNTALVQLGSLRLHAQIDTSIEANGRYWFEAQPSQNGDLVLKVIEHNPKGQLAGKDSIGSLLSQFQLSDTKLNHQLLQFLLTSNLPFTKEQLSKASMWIKELSKPSNGTAAIEMMLKKDLPFTNETFKSLIEFQKPSKLSTQLEQLAKLLDSPKFSNSEVTGQLKDLIVSLREGNSITVSQKVVESLVEQWFSSNNSNEARQAALKLLHELQVFSKSSLPETLLKTDQLSINGTSNPAEKEMIKQVVNSLSPVDLSKISARMRELAQGNSGTTSPVEANLIKELLDKFNQFTQSFLEDGTEVKHQLKQMIQTLGLEHEREIATFVKNDIEAPAKLESLKALLLQAIAELGPNGKEMESLLHRLTGMQLLAQESNGPIQQLYMQFPLALGNKLTDITIQWSGRKKKDGQIDSGFCRILFYLDLENINQTIIDMQVQNRVINISIFNETEGLQHIVSKGYNILKENLSSLDYILSSVKVIDSLEKKSTNQQDPKAFNFKQKDYQGVDLKI